MERVTEIDRRILGAMSGAERIRMLLREAGYRTLTDFAFKIRTHPQTVSYCINGDREYPEIRDALAGELGISRELVDSMIDAAKTPAGAS